MFSSWNPVSGLRVGESYRTNNGGAVRFILTLGRKAPQKAVRQASKVWKNPLRSGQDLRRLIARLPMIGKRLWKRDRN
jgi:hypothetical protein